MARNASQGSLETKNVEEFRRLMDEEPKLLMKFLPKIETKEVYKVEINGNRLKFIHTYIFQKASKLKEL
ncbi:MAG: hypothetical protein ACP5I6_07615 [Caldisphaera sp.]|jgi:hypothetical protein